MNSLKNIQQNQRVAQVNGMLKQAFPNQHYEARDERQADAVINQLESSPCASQFDNYFGHHKGQGSSTITAQSGGKQQSQPWNDDANQWLHSHESKIRDCLK